VENSLVLVDIGNTNFHILKSGKIFDLKEAKRLNGKIFYISVNEEKEKEFLKLNPSAVNLKKYVEFDTNYQNLGIDRIMACKTIDTGTIIDAGSAITIDFMKNKKHLGGIICPGIFAYKKAFVAISQKLDKNFSKPKNFPNSTQEALWEGSIGSVICLVKKYNIKPVFLTGGDGEYLNQFIDGIYLKDLVFRGMIETLRDKGLI
jgi:type III pantothenate kinase